MKRTIFLSLRYPAGILLFTLTLIIQRYLGSKDAKSFGRQSLNAQIDGAKKDIQNIVDHLKTAKKNFEGSRGSYANAEKNTWQRSEAVKSSERARSAMQIR